MRLLIVAVVNIVTLFICTGCGGGNNDKKIIPLSTENPIIIPNETTNGNKNDTKNFLSNPGPFSAGDFGSIAPVSYYENMKAKLSDATLIDIRTNWERQHKGYPKGFINNIPYQYRDYNDNGKYEHKSLNPTFVNDVTELVNGDIHKKIILICASGSRSGAHDNKAKASAAKLLSEKGFTNVYHITGGYANWINHGLPVIN